MENSRHQASSEALITRQDSKLELHSPTEMPHASSFLWNAQMMIQMNCRGYATAQFMQPEPAKYAHAPNLEAKTFMQPEQPYYAHHPGRFFYIKDLESDNLFSAPFEPVRAELDDFVFVSDQSSIGWQVRKNGIQVDIELSLAEDRPAELWSVRITNLDSSPRRISVTPYFPVGYMSWMNQSAAYDDKLQAIVCRSITPYQKYPDYFKNKDLKDLTYLLAATPPDSWEARQSAFEGEGGLHAPSSLENSTLSNSDALYETPTAAMQYQLELAPNDTQDLRFVFGPARDEQEISEMKNAYLGSNKAYKNAVQSYQQYVAQSDSPIKIETPDAELDSFVNHWLSRQVFYHGDVNRLSTDPQTRNFLQDAMGVGYIKPETARRAFLLALSQQNSQGSMPDGILLSDEAELKYINQVPHMDHCVWLPVCMSAYLDETNDYALLDEQLAYADTDTTSTVAEHVNRALRWLSKQVDHRGLNYIEQGDWCDPMNMVGYKGKGVSGWLTLASAYACKLWADVLDRTGQDQDAAEFHAMTQASNDAVNQHLWDDNWYARGITDDNVLFGTHHDTEGRIFLNPQAWALLSGAANADQQAKAIKAVEEQLETPFGVQMLAPAFTHMREDIGRVTQKYPGSAENGSVYNHAAAFYVYALYQIEDQDRAYRHLRQMLPGPDQADLLQRGQIPTFIPNYYRGAYQQHPRTAGRSSQLFNTGTVHWVYRCLIDGLFGVQGSPEGLMLNPQLPSNWPNARIERQFRGATFNISISRDDTISSTIVEVNGEAIAEPLIRNIEPGAYYDVTIRVVGKNK